MLTIPQTVLAGLVGFLGAILGSVATAWGIKKRFQLEDAAVRAAHRMLKPKYNQQKWTLRSFKLIRHHIGGFADNELRRILVRAGAVRYRMLETDEEMWGLLEAAAKPWPLGQAGVPGPLGKANLPNEKLFIYEPDPQQLQPAGRVSTTRVMTEDESIETEERGEPLEGQRVVRR